MNNGEIFGIVLSGLVFLLLFIVGILLWNGKGSFLIAGFNTMNTAEKEKYDKKSLCQFVGTLSIAIALCVPITILGAVFNIMWLIITGITAIFALIICGIVYANTGNRFKKPSI